MKDKLTTEASLEKKYSALNLAIKSIYRTSKNAELYKFSFLSQDEQRVNGTLRITQNKDQNLIANFEYIAPSSSSQLFVTDEGITKVCFINGALSTSPNTQDMVVGEIESDQKINGKNVSTLIDNETEKSLDELLEIVEKVKNANMTLSRIEKHVKGKSNRTTL